EINSFKDLSWEYLKKNLVLAKIQSILWPLMFMLIGSSLVIIVYVGGLQVINGEITIGMLTAFFGYLTLLIWPMIAFGWVTNLLQQGAASMGRLTKIMDTKPDIQNTDETDYSNKEIKGAIEFRNVSFSHKTSQSLTLRNINLQIPQGNTIAIVGYTGSGKSTIINLIPRLYDVTDGELLIDGINIKKIPLEVLRSSIGYVQQETFLFSDTLKENISYGVLENGSVVDDSLRDRRSTRREEGQRLPTGQPTRRVVDDSPRRGNNGSLSASGGIDEIVKAAEISQIAKDVKEFPKEYETMLGERGITLSGGQKQRTSIARAVMRNPKILILDDALSAVDTYTEEEILKRLRNVMKDRTSIIISHRISTVKDADMIVVLNNGEIVERGTHDELVAIGGIYADLYEKHLLEEELKQL
ncbi:MAG: ABC transporter ATP-binding protein, partial [Ignavibacteriales bacterium]|nr:ABC transporter ATP-binding protein [Ignavibacteriales bacterium]